ncbi:MAG: hypothetical protein H6673_11765 [Anaerolineales bacterium]|nr:hypothetical protein [Anaerolineales bacterium]
MANLTEILNDCIDRLAAGQSVQECLDAYPEQAPDLHPMLETGLLARRVNYAPAEVGEAHYRVRTRVLQAAATKQKIRVLPLRGWATMAASLLIIFFAAYVLVGFSAESSLPGESLYGVKRFNEAIRLQLSGHDPALEQQFAQRRVDEVQQLLEGGQSADVSFKGTVEAMSSTAWQVASLTVMVTDTTQQDADIQVGDSIKVEGQTTDQHQLVASRITLIEKDTPDQAPPISPTPPNLPTDGTPPIVSTPLLSITPHTPEPTIVTPSSGPETPTTTPSTPTPVAPPPTELDESATPTPSETPEESETPDDDDHPEEGLED